MKATFNRKELLESCQLASAAAAARDVRPILRNIKAVVGKSGCTLLATDTEFGIRLDVEGVKVSSPGAAILPAARTVAILRESTEDELWIEADGKSCVIRGTNNEFTMPSEDHQGFPDVPNFPESDYAEIRAGELQGMIRRTIFAVSKDDVRYATTGILWEMESDLIRLVATDGRRLSMIHSGVVYHGDTAGLSDKQVVPTKAMGLLDRVLGDPDEMVRVCIRENDAFFKVSGAVIYSRVVEGRFPDYKAIIPKETTSEILLPARPFLSAIKQAAIMTDRESNSISLRFDQDELTLSAHGLGVGKSKVTMPITNNAPSVEVRLNPKYLTETLHAIGSDAEVTIGLVDANRPVKLGIGDFACIIMPMA